jgi:hypothetical protein
MITEDIGEKSTDNYQQVPDAASNDELSHSLGHSGHSEVTNNSAKASIRNPLRRP